MSMRTALLSLLSFVLPMTASTAQEVAPGAPTAPAITHAFLATGGETYILDGAGAEIWRVPFGTRDGHVLLNGNVLLAVNRQGGEDARYPGGAAVEFTRDGKVVWEFIGTQSEVNTAVRLPNGNTLVTEAGPRPRLLEVSADGTIAVEVPLRCQLPNHHMQSRMARKLPNGNYLVPHLLDFAVREYDRAGKVVAEIGTRRWGDAETWPFTAIRLDDGHTLVTLTHGNRVVEFDAQGGIAWEVDNEALGADLLLDPCGAQRLPNGNTVITSYGRSGEGVKLFEVSPQKQVVWKHVDAKNHGIHHFQVLDTNGIGLAGVPLR